MRQLIRIMALLCFAVLGMAQVYQGGGGCRCRNTASSGFLTSPSVPEMREALFEGNPFGMACSEAWMPVILPPCLGGSASYTISNLPVWLTFNASTRELSATNPTLPEAASVLVDITYTCSNSSGSDSVTLAVNDLDGDGVSDCLEYRHGAVPLVNSVFGWIALTPDDEATYRTAVIERIPTSLVITTDAMSAINPADAADDFDGDGLTNAEEIAAGTNIFVAASTGTLAMTSQIDFGDDAVTLTTGDFDEDGVLDVAVSNLGNVLIFIGNGDGTFGPPTTIAGVGVGLYGVATADINNDGHLDLTVADLDDDALVPVIGDGAGGFVAGAPVAVGDGPTVVLLADFNNDNNVDAFVVNTAANTASIRLGNGAGGFSGSGTIAAGVQPFWAVAADFNADGNLDVALLNENNNAAGSLRILRGDGAGGFTLARVITIGLAPFMVTAGDVNGDGLQDIVQGDAGSDRIGVFRNDGNFQFTRVDNVGVTTPGAVVLADFNGDGHLDIASGEVGPGRVVVAMGNGDGTFANATVMATIDTPTDIIAADFNGDGKIDLGMTVIGSIPADPDLAIMLNQ